MNERNSTHIPVMCRHCSDIDKRFVLCSIQGHPKEWVILHVANGRNKSVERLGVAIRLWLICTKTDNGTAAVWSTLHGLSFCEAATHVCMREGTTVAQCVRRPKALSFNHYHERRMYSKNSTIEKTIVYKYETSTGFGLKWPSSWWWL